MTDRASADHAVGTSLLADEQVFAAEIRPHRSLGSRGVAIVLASFAALCAILGVPFYLLGAWPVIGFLGFDVFALWLAFRLSFRQARACEQIVLTYVELLVRKVSAKGASREWRFNPLWVRIETETDEDFGMTRLALSARDVRLDLASALSPHERADFASAFGAALAAARAGPRSPPPA